MKLVSSQKESSCGFTLIEVLVAISISAIVFTMLYSSFSQLVSAKRRVETKNELLGEANLLLTKIRHDLANSFARGQVNPSASSSDPYGYFKAKTDSAKNSSLVFTSFARDPFGHSDYFTQSEISYYLVPLKDRRKNMFALIRKDNYWIGNDRAGSAYPLSERVLGFSAKFLSTLPSSASLAEQDMVSEWDSRDKGKLPRAVQLRIVLAGDVEEEEEVHSILVAIPVDN